MKLCYQVATPDVAIADSVTAYQGSLEKSFGDLGRLGYDGVELMTCLLYTSNMVYGAEQMCHLYPNLGLGCYAEDDETKLEMAVHQAMKDGNQAIVGGYSTVQIAERLGMPAAMIHSGIEEMCIRDSDKAL